ncbi:MAG TPA: trypsin-like peptidase domain-containing protein [Spirochaetia bacterium]|nr:trypsin-like peptidase domain-containing protein [Spirochaetia bacterium]
MNKHVLYSGSQRTTISHELPPAAATVVDRQNRKKPLAAFYRSHERPILIVAGVVAALFAVSAYSLIVPGPHNYSQSDIDKAVRYTLENMPPALSPAAIAYHAIQPSVVRIQQMTARRPGQTSADPGSRPSELPAGGNPATSPAAPEDEIAVGTGVVVTDTGTILTNYHVVAGAPRLVVTFADGTEADADVVSVDAEKDLAVVQPRIIPDDLKPATLRSPAGLNPGDRVFAVGFPFGIGPSLSAGVISGLGRTYLSADGKHHLGNLIQFDAAVNPGNSGGPLVTEAGEVVGLVTSILNPTEQRVFIGIGFAVPIDTAAGAMGINPF